MPPFVTECPICHRKNEGETINDSILNLEHHPKCEYYQGIPIKYNGFIRDKQFDE